jgi:hypothetical protein
MLNQSMGSSDELCTCHVGDGGEGDLRFAFAYDFDFPAIRIVHQPRDPVGPGSSLETRSVVYEDIECLGLTKILVEGILMDFKYAGEKVSFQRQISEE